MSTKKEWKEVADRRFAENLAFRIIIEQIDRELRNTDRSARSRIRALYRLVRTAKEIGK